MRRPAVCALLAVLVLAGCDGARRVLGIDKAPPDEFQVYTRAPLVMPPDYALRPPQPGAARPQDLSPAQQARQSIFRAGEGQAASAPAAAQPAAGGRSQGELALLKGAGTAEPGIRRLVNEETTRLLEADRSFVDRLLFWRTPEAPGTVVDAQKEQQRIRENVALGRAPAEGETPVIQRKRRAFLEGLF